MLTALAGKRVIAPHILFYHISLGQQTYNVHRINLENICVVGVFTGGFATDAYAMDMVPQGSQEEILFLFYDNLFLGGGLGINIDEFLPAPAEGFFLWILNKRIYRKCSKRRLA